GVGDACDGTPRGDDDDNDGVGEMDDACPAQVGNTANGCYVTPTPPDDGGGGGTTTPPADRDGDGVYDISDACPTVPAASRNGCAKVQVTDVSAKAKKRRGKRSATVRVSTDGVATVRITVERKKGRRWVRVTRKTLVTSRNRTTLTVRGLRRGTHRARISVSSAAGPGSSATESFRVR
ncbi:MAG TPA: thrombospondin type 3 repeat-containing protein, partial [Solirubrobacteraceae bacterium]|nr:thrombospondin type 3 repeat-containing protein [Solirubrobacteraceae bacterium]